MRSVRSTYWSLAVAVVAMVGYGAINAASHTGPQPASFDPVLTSLSGILVAQLAIGILGVLVITSEYSTGMIRSTFAAAPQRHLVIAAKAGAFGAIAFTVGTVASVIAFLVGQAILGADSVSLTSPGAARPSSVSGSTSVSWPSWPSPWAPSCAGPPVPSPPSSG